MGLVEHIFQTESEASSLPENSSASGRVNPEGEPERPPPFTKMTSICSSGQDRIYYYYYYYYYTTTTPTIAATTIAGTTIETKGANVLLGPSVNVHR